jgi:hypothetical protein
VKVNCAWVLHLRYVCPGDETLLSTISNQDISVRECPKLLFWLTTYGSNLCIRVMPALGKTLTTKPGRDVSRTKVMKWFTMLLFSISSIQPKQVITQPEAPRMYHIGGPAPLFPCHHGALPAPNNPPAPADRDLVPCAPSTTTDRSYHIRSARAFTESSMRCLILVCNSTEVASCPHQTR